MSSYDRGEVERIYMESDYYASLLRGGGLGVWQSQPRYSLDWFNDVGGREEAERTLARSGWKPVGDWAASRTVDVIQVKKQ